MIDFRRLYAIYAATEDDAMILTTLELRELCRCTFNWMHEYDGADAWPNSTWDDLVDKLS